MVNMGFTGVYNIFLISAQNIDCGYSLEPPRRGGSNEYHNLSFEQKFEKYQNFLSEKFHFLVVKFSVYLNRRVFVMNCSSDDSEHHHINIRARRSCCDLFMSQFTVRSPICISHLENENVVLSV